MKNIAVYANEIARNGSFGVKIYSREILRNILQLDQENQYTFYAESDISGFFCAKNVKFSILKPHKFWAFTVFAAKIKKKRPDVLFIPIQIYPFWRKGGIKTVVVVHDLAFLMFPRHFTFLKRCLLAFHTKRAALLSDHIIVPSDATKKDLIKFYKIEESKISVVYHGFSSNLSKIVDKMWETADKKVDLLTKDTPYVLFVGSVQPRKNLVRLIEAFELMKNKQKDIKLVLCGGRGWMCEDTYRKAEESVYSEDIVFAGDVSDDILASLYKKALFFVFPSLYEGFGLPILEAMKFGLPVVCSKNSSISEVAGDSALFFDEYRISDMAEKMLMVYENANLRKELSQKGRERAKFFSWKKSAEETVYIFNEKV